MYVSRICSSGKEQASKGQGPGLIPFYAASFPIFPFLFPFSICFGTWYKIGAKQTHAEEMEVGRVRVFL